MSSRGGWKVITVYSDGREDYVSALTYPTRAAAQQVAENLLRVIVRVDTERMLRAVRAGLPGNAAATSGVLAFVVREI